MFASMLTIIQASLPPMLDPSSYLFLFRDEVLNPSQIIRRLTFLTQSLTIRFIQKFVQNITFFAVAWFINKISTRMT